MKLCKTTSAVILTMTASQMRQIVQWKPDLSFKISKVLMSADQRCYEPFKSQEYKDHQAIYAAATVLHNYPPPALLANDQSKTKSNLNTYKTMSLNIPDLTRLTSLATNPYDDNE